jgi:hypothetical protein
MEITWADNTKAVIDAIRGKIGRPVVFNTVHKDDCPICDIDPFTHQTTNPFCLTCSGTGWLVTNSGTTILAHITWAPSESMKWQAAGQYEQYACRIQIEYTVANEATVDGSNSVLVDGKRLRVSQKQFRGVPDINRMLIDLTEV